MLSLIAVRRLPEAKVTVSSNNVSANASTPIDSTLAGMFIEVNTSAYLKALAPISVRRLPGEKLIEIRAPVLLNAEFPIASTLAGIVTDVSPSAL
jgi:hypothetical protein